MQGNDHSFSTSIYILLVETTINWHICDNIFLKIHPVNWNYGL